MCVYECVILKPHCIITYTKELLIKNSLEDILTIMGDEIEIKIESERSHIVLHKSALEIQSYYNFLLDEIRDLEEKSLTQDVEDKIKMYDAILDIIGHMLLVAGVE